MESSQSLLPGTVLHDTYRIERVLGQGGFGITYQAFDTSLEKRMAIKEFFPKSFCNREGSTTVFVPTHDNVALVARFKAKFLKEAKTIAKLEHPHIVRIHAAFEENNTAYYVMDFIEGRSLSDMVRADGPLSEARALGYVTGVGRALEYLHARQMNHLDVKPANIMMRREDDCPILIDFGLAKQYDADGQQTSSTPVGISHGFAPIEQYSDGGVNVFSPTVDVYSLAATLYYLLSGIVPLAATKLVSEVLPFPDAIPARLVRPIAKAMSPSRSDRYPTVGAFLAAIASPAATEQTDSEKTDVGSESTVVDNVQNKNDLTSDRSSKHADSIIGGATKTWKGIAIGIAAAMLIAVGCVLVNQSKSDVVGDERNDALIVIADTASANLMHDSMAVVQTPAKPQVAEVTPEKPQVTASTPSRQNTFTVEKKSRDAIYTVKGVSFKMVAVEGGTFRMGATGEEPEPYGHILISETGERQDPYKREKPVHTVTLSNYSIGETEVTQALWQAVMGSNPSYYIGDNRPVEQVSWNDCQTFIRELNQLTGKQFRLPTEAEWEYAARGGSKSKGYQYAGSDVLDEVAWYDDNSGDGTHPVATKQPNELGLYDMSGNVMELCQDWYGSYPSGAVTNPTGAGSGSERVARGGAWLSFANFCRSGYRAGFPLDFRFNCIGLRLAL